MALEVFQQFLAGILFGPIAGGIVGALADVVGFFLNPMGAYMPHFTVTAFLSGFIPGAVMLYVFKNKRNVLNLLVAIALGQITTSVILVPYLLNLLFGMPFFSLAIANLISQAVNIPVYAYFILLLFRYPVFRTYELQLN